jgi:CBS domain-containing protein
MSVDTIPVSTYMSSKGVITEEADQNIYAACKIMHEHNIGCVVIVGKNAANDKDPVGIVTERDVVRLLGSLDPASPHAPLRNIMSKPLITISTNSSIKEAIETMQAKNIRRLLIVDKEKMVGIITDKDIFRAIMNNQALITSLGNFSPIEERRRIGEQFTEYWFRDIFHGR